MSDTSEVHPRKSPVTPLRVISLFLALTEAVAGVGVIQTSGGIQVSLTVFVIVFPLLVAGAFFAILWNKPYVLYSPYEFGSAAEAATYIEAISRDAEKLHEKVAEVAVEAEQIKSLRQELEEKIEKAKNEAIETSGPALSQIQMSRIKEIIE